jgi:hypothetical protein
VILYFSFLGKKYQQIHIQVAKFRFISRWDFFKLKESVCLCVLGSSSPTKCCIPSVASVQLLMFLEF